LLEEQHAALAQEIDDLLKDSAAVKQYGYRAENIEVITLPAGRNRPINEIVGLRIDGDLTSPVIEATVHQTGSSFEDFRRLPLLHATRGWSAPSIRSPTIS